MYIKIIMPWNYIESYKLYSRIIWLKTNSEWKKDQALIMKDPCSMYYVLSTKQKNYGKCYNTSCAMLSHDKLLKMFNHTTFTESIRLHKTRQQMISAIMF
jgi:hypothetical protein